jgi:formylglycine-generating enzyme required for sulfatase activity
MSRILSVVLAFVASMIATIGLTDAALAQKRVALVIGNSAYKFAPALTNPKNDATDIAAALNKVGFQVIDGFDLDKAAFDRKVRDFAVALKGADVGVLFYAGHGMQVAGENYLVPIDAKAEDATALEFEMLRVAVIHRIMEQQTNTNILFLDACRDNPLARNLARSLGTRSSTVGSGLARIESGVGTLISFSTQPGNVALDGEGRNSPFAGALAKQLATSNDDLHAMLIAVRMDVMQATQRKQVTWENSSLTGRFYFNPTGQTVSGGIVQQQASEAERAWALTKDTTSVAALDAFIRRFGDTYYGDLAKVRLSELKQQADAAQQAAKQKAEADARADAERQRLAMLQQDNERKRAEEAAKQSATMSGMKPGTVFRDCPDCPEMVVLPAGEFMMGSPESEAVRSESEGPRHKVSITKPFAVGRFEVTFDEWAACGSGGGCASNQSPSDKGWGRGKRPVINVSWNDATEYVTWLSKKSGKSYRLLTEAEWEYAARGVTKASAPHPPFATGANIGTDQANYNGQYAYLDAKKGVNRGKTVEVGSFPANAFGLHDMHGNAWEWAQDCYQKDYSGAPTDGSAVTTSNCDFHVLRGGSWDNHPASVRSAVRYWGVPSYSYFTGLRVARTLSP